MKGYIFDAEISRMNSELIKKFHTDFGSNGRPDHYPIPQQENDLLFFIQRNQNIDTIVYKLNRTLSGLVNKDLPMHAQWIKYTEDEASQELNEIQNQLAYGYKSDFISSDLFRFHFVSYPSLYFYIAADKQAKYNVITTLNNRRIRLSNIYVYALEFGVFPDVKFIEFYGYTVADDHPFYHKIINQ